MNFKYTSFISYLGFYPTLFTILPPLNNVISVDSILFSSLFLQEHNISMLTELFKTKYNFRFTFLYWLIFACSMYC